MDKLLIKVYDEFKTFYKNKTKKPHNYHQDLKLKKVETITKPKLYADDECDEVEIEMQSTKNNEILSNSQS